MLKSLLPSFAHELLKMAAALKPETKAEKHFEKKDWDKFEKNLRSHMFQKAVAAHPEADSTLKRYIKNFGGYLNSKEVVGRVPSRSSGKLYTVKKLSIGRLGCNCRDWQYVHSVRKSDCDHIQELKQGMKKAASPLFQAARGAGFLHRLEKQKQEKTKGLRAIGRRA